MDHRFYFSMCFILFGGMSVVTAMESMQFGYRILDRNTSEGYRSKTEHQK